MNPLLLPLIAVQALVVRARTTSLPPAGGPTEGVVGDGAPVLRLGVLGESTAAGLGVERHDLGFPGWLARELVASRGGSVRWSVAGQDGATVRRIRYKLLPALAGEFDIVVVLAGVNDVLARRSPQDWAADLAGIVDDLAARATTVVVAGVPPFDSLPSLPTSLGRYLAERASALDEASRAVCAGRAIWVSSLGILPEGPDAFADDRFHPSSIGYRQWAAAVAEELPVT